jgi:NADH-quinone oxidoreductase subunit L
LALFSLGVGWGPEFWKPDGSIVGHALEKAEPAMVKFAFAREMRSAHELHLLGGLVTLVAAAFGVGLAVWIYGFTKADPEAIRRRGAPLHVFLLRKWYFDELYQAVFVKPLVRLAYVIARVDKHSVAAAEAEAADRRIDPTSIDGVLSACGLMFGSVGQRLRGLQSGLLRRYILALVLSTVIMFAILTFLC